MPSLAISTSTILSRWLFQAASDWALASGAVVNRMQTVRSANGRTGGVERGATVATCAFTVKPRRIAYCSGAALYHLGETAGRAHGCFLTLGAGGSRSICGRLG